MTPLPWLGTPRRGSCETTVAATATTQNHHQHHHHHHQSNHHHPTTILTTTTIPPPVRLLPPELVTLVDRVRAGHTRFLLLNAHALLVICPKLTLQIQQQQSRDQRTNSMDVLRDQWAHLVEQLRQEIVRKGGLASRRRAASSGSSGCVHPPYADNDCDPNTTGTTATAPGYLHPLVLTLVRRVRSGHRTIRELADVWAGLEPYYSRTPVGFGHWWRSLQQALYEEDCGNAATVGDNNNYNNNNTTASSTLHTISNTVGAAPSLVLTKRPFASTTATTITENTLLPAKRARAHTTNHTHNQQQQQQPTAVSHDHTRFEDTELRRPRVEIVSRTRATMPTRLDHTTTDGMESTPSQPTNAGPNSQPPRTNPPSLVHVYNPTPGGPLLCLWDASSPHGNDHTTAAATALAGHDPSMVVLYDERGHC